VFAEYRLIFLEIDIYIYDPTVDELVILSRLVTAAQKHKNDCTSNSEKYTKNL